MPAEVEISAATVADTDAIVALIEANSVDRGGQISREFGATQVARLLGGEMPVVVARCGDRIAGVLFTAAKTDFVTPSVAAMLAAWPGRNDAYIYGPVCVEAAQRGRGLVARLFDRVKQIMPGREAILFIRQDNEASLRAHARLGMREVARFSHAGQNFIVLNHLS